MATYKSNKAQAASPTHYNEKGVTVEVATYTSSATFSAGDVVQMVKVDSGARLVHLYVGNSSADEIVVTVGDGIDADRYTTTASCGLSTLVSGIKYSDSLAYEYTASDTIDITVNGVQTLTTAVTLTLVAHLVYDN